MKDILGKLKKIDLKKAWEAVKILNGYKLKRNWEKANSKCKKTAHLFHNIQGTVDNANALEQAFQSSHTPKSYYLEYLENLKNNIFYFPFLWCIDRAITQVNIDEYKNQLQVDTLRGNQNEINTTAAKLGVYQNEMMGINGKIIAVATVVIALFHKQILIVLGIMVQTIGNSWDFISVSLEKLNQK